MSGKKKHHQLLTQKIRMFLKNTNQLRVMIIYSYLLIVTKLIFTFIYYIIYKR